jgi:hypothetical protein
MESINLYSVIPRAQQTTKLVSQSGFQEIGRQSSTEDIDIKETAMAKKKGKKKK